MRDGQERWEHLEREVARLRRWVATLGLAGVAALGGIAATGTSEIPDALSLRKLTIVDAEGRARIVAGTYSSGRASVQHYDAKGAERIAISTLPTGRAAVLLYDADNRQRLVADVAGGGRSRIRQFDTRGKLRILSMTDAERGAWVQVLDANGKPSWKSE
jgi:hypothetical protein